MKRIFTILLIFCMVAAVYTGAVLAEEPTGGTCGETVTWALADGTLTISGTGVMDNYTTGELAPWADYKYDITAIVIEPGITVIGEYAFWECPAQSISLPDTLTHIGTGAFHSCRNLSTVILPESLVSIGDEAFQYCDNLSTVYIPDSVTDIGANAFYSCYTLEQVIIPEGITQISPSTFAWCSSLYEVTLPSTLTTIGEEAFAGCGLSQIEIPYGVTYIGNYAFNSCEMLTDIDLPETLQEVGEYVFYWCNGLESITLPQSLTEIGWGMFEHCTSLTDITIPDTVTKISPFAFSDCYALRYIDLPDSISSIGHYAFSSCSALENFAIPEGVEIIDQGTFWSCTALEDITIPASVTSVGMYAFEGCDALTRVHFTGDAAQKADLTVDTNNDPLNNALWHCAVVAEDANTYTCPECGTYQTGAASAPTPVSVTVTPITLRPYVDSYTAYDANGNEIQRYEWTNQVVFELTMSNGDVIQGSGGSLYYDESYYDIQYTDSQDDGQVWLPSNSYTGTLSVMGITAEIPITVEELPIESITILPITRYADLDANTRSAYDENGEGFEYVVYYWTDSVTTLVTFKDGTTGTFGTTISYGDITYYMSLTDSQTSTNCWSAGNTYTETATVAGFTCPVTITIAEAAVEKVVADPLVLYEGGDGHMLHTNDPETSEAIVYYHYDWEELATYTIYFTDGTTLDACSTSFEYNGTTYQLGYTDSQDYTHWTAGNTYQERLGINDIKIYFDITVEPTPVVSVVAENVTVEDRIHGAYRSSYSEAAGRFIRYFHYAWKDWVNYTITFRDGTVLENFGADFTYRGRQYSISTSDSQGAESIWVVGETYSTTLTAMGVSTELSVTLAENPVDRIEVAPIVMTENGLGYLNNDYNSNGDYVEYYDYSWTDLLDYTVYFKDGSSLHCTDRWFVYDGYEIFLRCGGNSTADAPWTVGNTYTGTIYLFDLVVDVPVTIVSGPMGKSFTLSFEDEILVNFYYQMGKADDVVDTGMAVFYEDPSGAIDLESADEIFDNAVYNSESDRYMCQTKGIAAKEMGDTRYYVAYAKLTDGSYVYSQAYDYSPRKYATNMLGKASTSEKQKQLCVAMLNYGAAAQTYFGHHADDLMNAALTETQQAMVVDYDRSLFKGAVSCDKATDFAKTEGFTKKTATVSFDGAFAINFYMTPAGVADSMILYVWNPEVYQSVDSLTAENAEILPMTDKDGVYFAQVAGIAPKSLDDTYYVAAVYTDGNGNEYCTGIIAYSLSKYCLNNDSGNMAQLAQATAMYGYYAAQFFAG